MSEALASHGPVIATDACASLIAMYAAIGAGWTPPSLVTREMWESAKDLPDADPLKAWCGFCCSFSGMWFSSYAVPEAVLTVASGPNVGMSFKRRYHAASLDVLRRQLPKLAAVACVNFLQQPAYPFPGVIYCDPPYAGTVPYAGVAPFDASAFVQRVREWSAYTDVFVSEYDFPLGQIVFEAPVTKAPTLSKKTAVERLYYIAKGSL